jgi:hypothetical protein
MKRAAKKRQNKATSKKALKKTAPSSNDQLRGRLQALVASPALRLVDLTQTLSPDFPPIVLPPEMGQSRPFRMEQISRYDESGPGLVLEQCELRRAYRHAFRRANPLDFRPRPAEQFRRCAADRAFHRAGLRDRLQRARGQPTPISCSRSATSRLGRNGTAALRRPHGC